MTGGPNLAFLVYPKKRKKTEKLPTCRACHSTVEPGNLTMTINYVVSQGIEVTAYYHWRCVESRADDAGFNTDEKFFEIRNQLAQGEPLFPSKG